VTYLPTLSAPRKSLHITNYGITPFVLPPAGEDKPAVSQTNGQYEIDVEKAVVQTQSPAESDSRRASIATMDSFTSVDSTAPLTQGMHGNV